MIVLRLTNKVIKEFRKQKPELVQVDEVSGADEWYVNLFRSDRRKCLLFTHSGTLFSFVMASVSRKDIQSMRELFRKELAKTLFYEEFSSGQIEKFMKRAQEITIAKTASRSVLASMNQILFEYPYIMARFAHLGDEGLLAANRELNTMLHGAIGEGRHGYGEPQELFKELVTGEKAERVGKRTVTDSKQTAYVFEATMTHYSEGKNIMRRVAVSGNKSLYHLAQVILGAFDFDCDHCFGFYGDIHKHPGKEQTEIYEAFVDAHVEPTSELAKSVERTKITTAFNEVGKKMLFMFDYGQDWRFVVELKEIQKESTEKLPKVLCSVGVAPPQYPSQEEI
ncbi:MAG: hypothetical protein JW847_07375 [Candidatus Omnitrophica bacterium]|nr:hypothetical protein [Candidatus Omnitrophota bacterium]